MSGTDSCWQQRRVGGNNGISGKEYGWHVRFLLVLVVCLGLNCKWQQRGKHIRIVSSRARAPASCKHGASGTKGARSLHALAHAVLNFIILLYSWWVMNLLLHSWSRCSKNFRFYYRTIRTSMKCSTCWMDRLIDSSHDIRILVNVQMISLERQDERTLISSRRGHKKVLGRHVMWCDCCDRVTRNFPNTVSSIHTIQYYCPERSVRLQMDGWILNVLFVRPHPHMNGWVRHYSTWARINKANERTNCNHTPRILFLLLLLRSVQPICFDEIHYCTDGREQQESHSVENLIDMYVMAEEQCQLTVVCFPVSEFNGSTSFRYTDCADNRTERKKENRKLWIHTYHAFR